MAERHVRARRDGDPIMHCEIEPAVAPLRIKGAVTT
jgi:hypothetical protein